MASRIPKPPPRLKSAGNRLWRAVLAEYELEEHEAGLLLQMCRTADRLDDLAVIVDREGVMQPGVDRVHPAAVEHRQLAITFARLAAALRLPAGEDSEQDRRPQRRMGVRGTYAGLRGLGLGVVPGPRRPMRRWCGSASSRPSWPRLWSAVRGLWLARDTLRVVRLYIAEAVPWEPADRLEEIRVRYLESRLATLRELLVVAEAERVLTRLDPEVDR